MRHHFSITAFAFSATVLALGPRETAAQPKTFTRINQTQINALVTAGDMDEAFDFSFETGDFLFSNEFNEIDGSGAKVGTVFNGTGMIRFTRFPRAQLQGTGEWGKHVPSRATGPNAQACASCHNKGAEDGAGDINSNVHRDPGHTGNEFTYIQRNTPHVFAPGALQRLAEDMTAELKTIRQNTINSACAAANGTVRTGTLTAKGTSFGTISVTHTSGTGTGCVTSVNTSAVVGVDANLVVKPFQWKGSVTFLRDFIRGAQHNELGMQAVEMAGPSIDGDGDGVTNELSTGDVTAATIYMAAQPRPATLLELNTLGLLETPLTSAQIAAIGRGNTAFTSIGCASCHHPNKTLTNNIFSEPSQSADYRDATFPAGQSPSSQGVSPSTAVTFDLTADQPDNVIEDANGAVIARLGSLRKNASGQGIVDLFSDLKRHNLGSGVAEPIDEAGTGASVWLTKPLWGVGSTAPYMHDGSAPTFEKAISMHGTEAATSRTNFNNATQATKDDLKAFLNNLVLFKIAEDE